MLATSIEQRGESAGTEERLDHQRDAEHDQPELNESPYVPLRSKRRHPCRSTSPYALGAVVFGHSSINDTRVGEKSTRVFVLVSAGGCGEVRKGAAGAARCEGCGKV